MRAHGNSVVAEDVVRGCYVEIEIRQSEIQEIVLSTRLPRSAPGIVRNRSRVAAVELLQSAGLEIVCGRVDPLPQLVERGFGVCKTR